SLSPFDSWLLLRGLRTLPMRVAQHNRNALALARFLEGHDEIGTVYYPGLESHPQHELAVRQMTGFGGVLSFQMCGGFEAAERFIASLRRVARAASLGSAESLVIQPAAMWAGTLTED